MKSKELWLAAASALLGIGAAVAAYHGTPYWQALLIEIAATGVGLSLALIVVNVYLDRNARREAVKPLVHLITPSISDHHNRLLNKGFSSFGKVHFMEMMRRYQENNADPRVLTPVERDTLYDIIKADRDYLVKVLDKLELDLRELALILGWSFKPDILRSSFNCRFAIIRLRNSSFDDTEAVKLEVCESFLDTDIAAFAVHAALVELVGMKSNEVYSDK